MTERFFVTNYDRDEIISLIREAFKVELKESLNQQEKEIDYNVLMNIKEVAEMLHVSKVTMHTPAKLTTLRRNKLTTSELVF